MNKNKQSTKQEIKFYEEKKEYFQKQADLSRDIAILTGSGAGAALIIAIKKAIEINNTDQTVLTSIAISIALLIATWGAMDHSKLATKTSDRYQNIINEKKTLLNKTPKTR